jgi:hypothetical protein
VSKKVVKSYPQVVIVVAHIEKNIPTKAIPGKKQLSN